MVFFPLCRLKILCTVDDETCRQSDSRHIATIHTCMQMHLLGASVCVCERESVLLEEHASCMHLSERCLLVTDSVFGNSSNASQQNFAYRKEEGDKKEEADNNFRTHMKAFMSHGMASRAIANRLYDISNSSLTERAYLPGH